MVAYLVSPCYILAIAGRTGLEQLYSQRLNGALFPFCILRLVIMMMMPLYPGAPWLPRFEGTEGERKYTEWKEQIKGLLGTQDIDEAKKVEILWNTLTGVARRQVSVLVVGERNTTAKIFAHLDKLYRPTLSAAQVRSQFYSCSQQVGENTQAYILRLRELHCGLRELDPDTAPSDETLRDQLLLGLVEGPLRQALRTYARRNPEGDFAGLHTEVSALEKEFASTCAPEVACQVVNPISVPNPPQAEPWRAELKKVKEEIWGDMQKQIQGLAEELRQLRPLLAPAGGQARGRSRDRSPPSTSRRQARPRSPSPPRQQQGRASYRYVTQRNEWDQDGRPICRDCKGVGHFARNCPGGQPSLN